MEIYRIKSKETKKNPVTGWIVPAEYTTGTFDIVGFNPETNMVFCGRSGKSLLCKWNSIC